jgi:hypothetical protein
MMLSTANSDNNNNNNYKDGSNTANPPGLSPYILQTSSEVNTEQSYHAVQMASRNSCFAHNTYYVISWCPTCSFNI